MLISILNVLGFVLYVTTNALANIIPINGQQTGEISNRLDVLFTPAGYVFSIWGIIYILTGIWVIRQIARKKQGSLVEKNVGFLFFLSCILNATWIFCWHYNLFGLSVIVMLLLLITLSVIYVQIKKNNHTSLDILPFSVYLGWISVATVANISYWLTEISWSGWGLSPDLWAIIMMIVATFLAGLFIRREHDIAYVLVFVWALFGIGVANSEDNGPVLYVSYVLGIVLLIECIAEVITKIKNASSQERV